MTHSKPGAIILSLTLCVLASAAAPKTSRDATHVGYMYDKPGRTLEVPKSFKEPEEEASTEEINSTKTPAEGPYEEYLPPKAGSLNHRSGGGDDRFRRLNDEKRDVQKSKRKFPKHQQFSFQGHGGGGNAQRNGFGFENKKD